MHGEPTRTESLEQHVVALVGASSPSEIFKILLKGSQEAAPRGAIFLVRQGSIKGWGSIGYDPEVAAQQRAFTSAADAGWLGQLVSDTTLPLQQGGGGDPDVGLEPKHTRDVDHVLVRREKPLLHSIRERRGILALPGLTWWFVLL